MAGDGLAIFGFFNGVGNPLGGDGCAHFACGSNSRGNQVAVGARAGAILNSDDFRIFGEGFEAVPDGVLAFFASSDQTKWLSKVKLFGQGGEVVLKTVAHDEDDLVDTIG